MEIPMCWNGFEQNSDRPVLVFGTVEVLLRNASKTETGCNHFGASH